MDEIVFYAEGVPAPQGSKTHVGGGRLIESSRQVGAWRDAVRSVPGVEIRIHGEGRW